MCNNMELELEVRDDRDGATIDAQNANSNMHDTTNLPTMMEYS